MNFFNNYFLYLVPKNEKNTIRKKVVDEDHKGYFIILLCILFFQIAMLVRSYIIYGASNLEKPWIDYFRYLYIFLASISILSLIFTTFAKKRKNIILYFVIVNIVMLSIQLWGVGITVLNSHDGIDLTTFSYVLLATVCFITLEPWLVSINTICITIILNLCLNLYSDSAIYYTSGTLINSLSILVFAIIMTTFNFYRRIKKLNVETENEKLQEMLAKKAVIDDLTQVYNRTYLTTQLQTKLNYGKNPSALLMIDVDHFKKINDIYGHTVGDNVLRQIGNIITLHIKNGEYAIRYGGEEFLVYFDTIDILELKNRAQTLRKFVENHDFKIKSEEKVTITISIGIAYATENISYSSMISLADSALYKAKTKRNTCCLVQQ